jgi:hypothetical protein
MISSENFWLGWRGNNHRRDLPADTLFLAAEHCAGGIRVSVRAISSGNGNGAGEGKLRTRPVNAEMIGLFARD